METHVRSVWVGLESLAVEAAKGTRNLKIFRGKKPFIILFSSLSLSPLIRFSQWRNFVVAICCLSSRYRSRCFSGELQALMQVPLAQSSILQKSNRFHGVPGTKSFTILLVVFLFWYLDFVNRILRLDLFTVWCFRFRFNLNDYAGLLCMKVFSRTWNAIISSRLWVEIVSTHFFFFFFFFYAIFVLVNFCFLFKLG